MNLGSCLDWDRKSGAQRVTNSSDAPSWSRGEALFAYSEATRDVLDITSTGEKKLFDDAKFCFWYIRSFGIDGHLGVVAAFEIRVSL